jgi:hypothetical protein
MRSHHPSDLGTRTRTDSMIEPRMGGTQPGTEFSGKRAIENLQPPGPHEPSTVRRDADTKLFPRADLARIAQVAELLPFAGPF